MPDPKPKAMSVEEAADALLWTNPAAGEELPNEIKAALAVLRGLAKKNAALKAEVESRRKDFKNMRATIDGLDDVVSGFSRAAGEWRTRAKKAEAALVRCEENYAQALRLASTYKETAERSEAELDAVRPLLDWAKKADASLIAHFTTARRKDKCVSCEQASASISALSDILADMEALATLESLAESEAGLRAENERMKRTLTYQTNELGNTKERTRKLQADNIALKEEVERLIQQDRDEGALKCPECLEPVEQIRCSGCLLTFSYADTEHPKWKARAEKAEADLARWKPLIEAVEKASIGKYQDIVGASPVLIPFISEGEDDILRAALSCREEK